MGEHGSFSTEFIGCKACFASLRALLTEEREDKFTDVHPLNDDALPIIAGMVVGMYAGEEADMMDVELRYEIERVICHPVRICVIPEGAAPRMYRMEPHKGDEE